ncbi:helix-turn-helix domain-containing protein [Enterococcus sp. AZ103]|uniref:helix-turn-helix domain-containing protein n=1 Tax=Enterococcus sp. AZ103 TaxID=2774628 RepID=UPI003F251ED6
MSEINQTFAQNLKLFRKKRNLSLDNVSALTGVSKSVLAQIEKGTANPTINTVWKIANGLKVSFTELMAAPEEEYKIVRQNDIQPLLENDGKYRNFPIFLFADSRNFEVYTIELEPGAFLAADPHPFGTEEFITVFSGSLQIAFNTHELTISEKESLQFKADQKHSYKNPSQELTVINMIIWYDKKV